MVKVFIGVGHGGSDPGALGNGFKESEINLVEALTMKSELERHGVIVGISRTKNENDSLSEEIKEANAFCPDLAIDIHNNAGGGDGFEVYYQTNAFKAKSLAYAKSCESEILKIGQNSRGCKTKLNTSNTDYFGFLRQIKYPSILVEGAFIDNAKDVTIMDTITEQQAFGIAYAKATLSILGIPWRELIPVADDVLYRVQVGAFSQKSNAESLVAKLKTQGYSPFITTVKKN